MIKPVLSRQKVGARQVFTYGHPEVSQLTLFVSASVRRAMINEKCSGADIQPAPIV